MLNPAVPANVTKLAGILLLGGNRGVGVFNRRIRGQSNAARLRQTIFSLAARVPLSRLIVPVLLAVGWIVGCALMVYIVFS